MAKLPPSPLFLHSSPTAGSQFGPGFGFFLGAVLLSIFVRLRLLEMPFERDEGEYAYFGWLMLQGIPPYAEAYNMKLPGTYALYALFQGLFGSSVTGIHSGLLLSNLLTVWGMVLLGRRIISVEGGWLAGAAFALLSLSPTVRGHAGHATHFVALFAVWGAYWLSLALVGQRGRDYLGSGVVLGLAILAKQPGLFFGLFGILLIVWHARAETLAKALAKTALFAAGLALPLALCMALFAALGLLPDLLFWTFLYAMQYGGQVSPAQALAHLQAIVPFIVLHSGLWPLFLLAGIGLFMTVRNRPLLWLMLLAGLFSAATGFYFRPHYFITLLPAIALLAAAGTGALMKHWRPRAALLLAVFGWHGWQLAPYLFTADPNTILRTYYGRSNPFVESTEIAAYLKAHSRPQDKIAILGSEPQIYFYAQRHAATGFIYTYSLMENHPYALSMQQKMAAEIERNAPRFIVLVQIHFSWLKQADSPTYLFQWMDRYLSEHYELAGFADMSDNTITRYRWDGAGWPQGEPFIAIFKRRDTGLEGRSP